MSGKYKGLKAVVTGASRGAGADIARILNNGGAEVLGVARKAGKADLEMVLGDVGEQSTAQATAKKVAEKWGSLDLLINNAAVITDIGKHLNSGEQQAWEDCFKINVFGPQWMSQALAPFLLKGKNPRIINVSSEAGSLEQLKNAGREMPAYRLSKYALNGLTMMAAEFYRGKIAVNSVHPGWLRTDMGGSQATSSSEEGALRVLELLDEPFEVTGEYWNGDTRDVL